MQNVDIMTHGPMGEQANSLISWIFDFSGFFVFKKHVVKFNQVCRQEGKEGLGPYAQTFNLPKGVFLKTWRITTRSNSTQESEIFFFFYRKIDKGENQINQVKSITYLLPVNTCINTTSCGGKKGNRKQKVKSKNSFHH